MGVDYYTCSVCGYNFPDCGDEHICCNCNKAFCSKECANPIFKYSEKENYDMCISCVICRGEFCDDKMLMKYLLKKCNLTKEQAKKEYLKELKK